jgi:hypothetical protein
VASLLLVGCGRSVGDVTICGPSLQSLPTPTDSQRAFAAAHPWPQLQYQGGSVFKSPRVVSVFFGDAPHRDRTEALLQSYGCTTWWREAVAEYGVGDLTWARTVVLREPFPSTSNPDDIVDFQTWVARKEAALAPRDGEVFVFLRPKESTRSARSLWGGTRRRDSAAGRYRSHSSSPVRASSLSSPR